MPPAGSFWEPQSRDLLPAISERPLMVQCLHEARQGKTDERADRIPEGGSIQICQVDSPEGWNHELRVDIRKVGLDGARGPWIEMHESRMVRSSCDDEVNA